MSFNISSNQIRNSFEAGHSSNWMSRFEKNGSKAIDPDRLNLIRSGNTSWAPISEYSCDNYNTLTTEVTFGGPLEISITVPYRTKWSPSSISLTFYDDLNDSILNSLGEWVTLYDFNTGTSGRAPQFSELKDYSLKYYIYYISKVGELICDPCVYYLLPPITMNLSNDSSYSISTFQAEFPCIGREDYSGD